MIGNRETNNSMGTRAGYLIAAKSWPNVARKAASRAGASSLAVVSQRPVAMSITARG